MDVFLMIRRNKTTIFADAKETTTVLEVKKIIEGILKKAPEEQRLYKTHKDKPPTVMEDSKQLSEYGYLHTTARAQLPETIGLVYRTAVNGDKEEFEPLDITPVSTPPELPDVMKGESTAQTNADDK
jgi:transcription elongation factor B subunit 2